MARAEVFIGVFGKSVGWGFDLLGKLSLMAGLKSANPSDFAPAARSLLSVLYRPVASVIWYKTHLLASLEDLFPSVVL